MDKMLKELPLSGRLGKTGLLGGPGYTLPDLSKATDYSFAEIAAGAVRNIKISGEPGEGNRLIFAGGTPPTKELVLAVNRLTADALVIIGDEVTYVGSIMLGFRGQTAILAGGAPEVGHSGRINVQMWGTNQLLFLGRGTSSNGAMFVVSYRDNEIVVGDDCMFADGIYLATSDQHAVMDLNSGQQLNTPASILLEPHVWVCRLSSINKGVTIGMGSIVGNHALVNRSIPRFCSVGGVPARVVREGTTWDRTASPRPATLEYLKRLAKILPDRTR